MKKIILISLILGTIASFGQNNNINPFENEKFKYVFENVSTIFGDDFRCKFIAKQQLLYSFHMDNGNKDIIRNIEDSLTTYGKIIQLEADFDKISDPIEVTKVYYSRYCKIPEQKWLDELNLKTLNEYIKNIEMLRGNK